MRWINCLFIFFIADTFSTTKTAETPEKTIVNEQIKLLKAKMVRLRNLKDLMRNSTLFRNLEGTCPLELYGQLRCKTFVEPTNECICWNANKEKVNWFTADAFCDYHGMHLISFPFAFEDQIIDELTAGIWTSANDIITRRVWLFRNGHVLSDVKGYRSKSLEGLDTLTLSSLRALNEKSTSRWTQPTTCISSSSNNRTINFYPESCLEKKLIICQQFLFNK